MDKKWWFKNDYVNMNESSGWIPTHDLIFWSEVFTSDFTLGDFKRQKCVYLFVYKISYDPPKRYNIHSYVTRHSTKLYIELLIMKEKVLKLLHIIKYNIIKYIIVGIQSKKTYEKTFFQQSIPDKLAMSLFIYIHLSKITCYMQGFEVFEL